MPWEQSPAPAEAALLNSWAGLAEAIKACSDLEQSLKWGSCPRGARRLAGLGQIPRANLVARQDPLCSHCAPGEPGGQPVATQGRWAPSLQYAVSAGHWGGDTPFPQGEEQPLRSPLFAHARPGRYAAAPC